MACLWLDPYTKSRGPQETPLEISRTVGILVSAIQGRIQSCGVNTRRNYRCLSWAPRSNFHKSSKLVAQPRSTARW